MAGSKGTSYQIDARNIDANPIDITVSALSIIEDSVNPLPLLVQHARDVIAVKFFSAFQEIEKIFVDGKTRFLQPRVDGRLAEFQIQTGQTFRVIFGRHLSEHISGGHQGAD